MANADLKTYVLNLHLTSQTRHHTVERCICRTHNGQTAVSWRLFLSRNSEFGLTVTMTLTFDLWDLENLYSTSHSRDEYFCQVSMTEQRYDVAWNRCKGTTDNRRREKIMLRATTVGRSTKCCTPDLILSQMSHWMQS